MRQNANPTFKQIVDIFYRVGTYYQTSDKNFDPNMEWGGTWTLLPEGTILVSGSTDRSGNTNKLIDKNLPDFQTTDSVLTGGQESVGATDLTGTGGYWESSNLGTGRSGIITRIDGYSDAPVPGATTAKHGCSYFTIDARHEHKFINSEQKDISTIIKSPIVYTWYRTA